MSRLEMPRVYELQDLIDDPSNPSAYFQDFEASLCDPIYGLLKKRVWLAREREFKRLDADSWRLLKEEVRPYLSARDQSGRGWEQLINILNQARAHNYLEDKGCSLVCFIPREKKQGIKTPDLKAELNGKNVLCEVKTINPSEAEIDRRKAGRVGSATDLLGSSFLSKLDKTLESAKCQMDSYDANENVKRIVFVVVNFDDNIGEYKTCFYAQIDNHLAASSIQGIETVFYNQRTVFHTNILMLHAHVVNEPS
jgi:hypothetical protein